MKRLFILVFIVFPVLGYLVFLLQFELSVTRNEIGIQNPPNYYDYKGITNVHTNLSTGSLPPREVIRKANELNFDFMFLTEVNVFPRPEYLEGYHDKLLVITAGEYSYLDSRLVYYNANDGIPPEQRGQAQVFFADKLSQDTEFDDGFIFLAHPLLKSHRWRGDIPEGIKGLEIINLKRVLEKAWNDSKLMSLGSLFIYPFNSPLALIRLYSQPEEELKLWDSQLSKRKTVGVFAADATAKAVISPSLSLEFPTYKTSLAIGSNHLLLTSELTGNFESDKKKVQEALFKGQFYMSLDIVADPKGFFAEVRQDGKRFPIGSEVDLKKNMEIVAKLPDSLEAPFEVLLIKDGEPVATSNEELSRFKINEPGVYRVEVRVIPIFPLPGGRRWIPWIYTNPFYISKS